MNAQHSLRRIGRGLGLARTLAFERNPFSWRDLAAAAAGRAPRSPKQLISHCLRSDEAGREYYQLDGRRWYFDPPYPVGNRSQLREGTRIVLAEAYFDRDEMLAPAIAPRPGEVVLDIGGHIGTSALAYARRVAPGGHVYTFEPVMVDSLRRNLADQDGLVTIVDKAVADRPGTAEMLACDHAIDSSMARPPGPDDHTRQVLPVDLTTVDEFVADQGHGRVDLIKLDIEGAEELALRGAVETIRTRRPRFNIASYHTDSAGEAQHHKLVRFLKEMGYRVEEIVKHGRGVRIHAWPGD